MATPKTMSVEVKGRLRLWLVFWLPGALLLMLGLLVIPNPTGRWAWTYGSEGSRTPLLKVGQVVGQPVPAPGRPFSYLGLRFHLKGAKTGSTVEVRLLRGGERPRDPAALKRRTLISKVQPHKMLRGDRFLRLDLPEQAGQEALYLTVRLLKRQGSPKIKLWLDKAPDWKGKPARLFGLDRAAPPGRALGGHLSLEWGAPGEEEPLLLALAAHWWGWAVLLLLFPGSLALLTWLLPDPARFRLALARGRQALREARPRWPAQELRGWLPAVLLVCAVHAVLLLQTAWLSDDIYITLRSVANLAAGDGPIWNPGERVQAFTHPLWMGLLTVVQLLTGSNFAAALGLGLACSGLTVYLVVFRLAICAPSAFLTAALLSVSMAYVDFSTSGLENPLLHLLLVLFALTYLHGAGGRGTLFRLWFLFCLALLTRLDAALLFLPALGTVTWRQLRSGALGPVAWFKATTLALLPLAGWLLFALFYYGNPLPNTAYAKLAAGIPRLQLMHQGGFYLLNSLAWDPATLVVIVTATVVPYAVGDRKLGWLLAGAWLYILYTVWIGGCFMSGRFLTAPLLVAALVWSRLPLSRITPALIPALVLLAMTLGTRFGMPGVVSGQAVPRIAFNGVADERSFYFNERSLMSLSRDRDLVDSSEAISSSPQSLSTCGAGLSAFRRGSEAYVLDPCALGDAFLARLPAVGVHSARWRIGHLIRIVPRGYAQTLTSRQNLIISRDRGAFYERVRAVISWDLLSSRRAQLLWRLLWGSEDHLLMSLTPGQLTLAERNLEPAAPRAGAALGSWAMGDGGLNVDLGERKFSRTIHFTVNPNARFRVYFIRNNRYQTHRDFGPSKGKAPVKYQVQVPGEVSGPGYDRLYLLPIKGRRNYRLFRVTLN